MKQYLDLVKHLPENEMRNLTELVLELKVFSATNEFNLSEGFLVTTKNFLKSIIYELLGFLKGDTNIQYLQENGVKIWDEWADENGNLGPGLRTSVEKLEQYRLRSNF